MAAVPVDHVELLVSSASAWGLLMAPPVAALSAGSGRVALSPQQACDLLLAMRSVATGEDPLNGHLFEPVGGPFEPVQIIKAVHAFQAMGDHLAASAWEGSVGYRLVESVGRAGCERLAGYSDAAWFWSRSLFALGVPIGIGTKWRPDIDGLRWHGPDVDPQTWMDARLVLITVEALLSLPATLPPRVAPVYVLGNTGGDMPDLWSCGVAVSGLLWWPECESWLAEQLGSAVR